MRHRIGLAVVLAAFVLAVNLAGQSAAQAKSSPLPAQVFIGTLKPGTSYNAVAMGMAKVLSDVLPMRVSVRPYTGPSAWLPVMERGGLAFGILSMNDATWAYRGDPAFVEKHMKNVRLIARGNWLSTSMGIIVRKSSPFHKITDLRGKRVTSDFGTNLVAGRLVAAWLNSVGMSYNDVRKVPVTGVIASAKALQAGRVDGAFGASPFSAFIQALNVAVPIRALPYADASPAQCRHIAPDAATKIVPASKVGLFTGHAPILTGPYCTIMHPTALVAGANVPPAVAYAVLKAIWQNVKKLHPYTHWLRGWTHKNMFWAKPTIPYHSGAIRFYKEQGLWTAATGQRQQQLLSQAK